MEHKDPELRPCQELRLLQHVVERAERGNPQSICQAPGLWVSRSYPGVPKDPTMEYVGFL